MPGTHPNWQDRLAQLPKTTHIAFFLRSEGRRRQQYFYASWYDEGQTRLCYIGKNAPLDHPCFGNYCRHHQRQWRSQQDRLARLQAVPKAIHICFSLHSKRRPYWSAIWTEEGQQVRLYLGTAAPEDHPCFEGRCGHPYRKRGQPERAPSQRRSPPLGYQPSPKTIERQRKAHLGKANRGPRRHAQQLEGRLQPVQGKPLYIALADQLAEEVQQGRYPSGQPLPPAESTARRFNVGVNTIVLAYLLLVQRGLVRKQAGDFFVRPPRPKR